MGEGERERERGRIGRWGMGAKRVIGIMIRTKTMMWI